MWKIPLDTTKKLKGWEKPSLQYKLIIYKHCLACISLYLACTLEWTWKWKMPTLCCCFTWIVFIELDFVTSSDELHAFHKFADFQSSAFFWKLTVEQLLKSLPNKINSQDFPFLHFYLFFFFFQYDPKNVRVLTNFILVLG